MQVESEGRSGSTGQGSSSSYCKWGQGWWRRLDAVLQGNLGSCHPCWCYLGMLYLPYLPFHWNDIPMMAVASFSRMINRRIKGTLWIPKDITVLWMATWSYQCALLPSKNSWGMVWTAQSWLTEAPPTQLRGLKGSAANIVAPEKHSFSIFYTNLYDAWKNTSILV